MNYCRRCESDYEKPGTCNCYAEKSDTQPWTGVYPDPPLLEHPTYPPSVVAPLTVGPAWRWEYDATPHTVRLFVDTGGTLRDHNGFATQGSWT